MPMSNKRMSMFGWVGFALAMFALMPSEILSSSCTKVNPGELRFCDHIGYNVYVEDDSSVLSVDMKALQTFISSRGPFESGCCRESLKRMVCAEMMPRCQTANSTSPPLQVCRAWSCNAFYERTETEKKIAGLDAAPCFGFDAAYCDGQSSTEESTPVDYACTCPDGSTETSNSMCLPKDLTVNYGGNSFEVCVDTIPDHGARAAPAWALLSGTVAVLLAVLTI